MPFFDYHMHTSFSPDSETPIRDMVAAACAEGLKEIAITDHMDLDSPTEYYIPFDAYFQTLGDVSAEFGDKIVIKKGLELGFTPDTMHLYDTLVAPYHFDFIILSTHSVLVNEDVYQGEYFENKTKEEAFTQYLNTIYYNIQNFHSFHVYGHLDYVSRYAPYPDKSMVYHTYKDIIDDILKLLRDQGKGFEVNTASFKYGQHSIDFYRDVLCRYKELGGEILTVGADAHTPAYVGKDFHLAYDMVRNAGFEYITTFKNGEPTFSKYKH